MTHLLLPLMAQIVKEAPPESTEWSTGALVFITIGLLLAAIIFIILEFLIVSGGILGIAASGSAIAAISVGFSVHPAVGWSLLFLVPIIFYSSVRIGLRRLQHSSLVMQASIDSDAGYEHVASEHGVEVGSSGTLSTDAMPTGRCHFAGGEMDVSLESGSGQRGDPVIVTRIDGPEIWVRHQGNR